MILEIAWRAASFEASRHVLNALMIRLMQNVVDHIVENKRRETLRRDYGTREDSACSAWSTHDRVVSFPL